MIRFANSLRAFRLRRPSCLNTLREALIIFTRYPEPGKTKTRLIPLLGPDGAAGLHRRMTEHTIALVRHLRSSRPIFLEVRYEGGNRQLMERWLGPDIFSRPQGSGDLGERMARAFHEAFQSGMDRVVLLGTDIPGITDRILLGAFENLRYSDIVLGPASDGGYYLIGLRRDCPQLFVDVPWGTEKVLERTRRISDDLGHSAVLLETLDDVDRPEDLHLWEKASKQIPKRHPVPRISIIIPTLNEAANLPTTLGSTLSASDAEVIIVDGGSSDETVELARSWNTKVLISAPGRARQMNVGADHAMGEVFLFLHGDTRLPTGFESHVHKILARPGVVAGAFQLRVDGQFPGVRIMERLVNLRSRHLQFPYADQAIFLRADLFREMGGFPDMPIMEDFELIQRLRRRGRILIAPVPVLTSARRWENLGIMRATLINYAIPLAYYLGVSPSRLAHWYDRQRGIS
ncbi:MAG: TIGR04283 family arsenosugar biosynthesis glycosyltransferase [Syntrophobacterales bacterium]|nr:MAG: TIGR04283 family arsenosugar biosynthesis glycosyltransferase [Syntrophobacterales bacterium]